MDLNLADKHVLIAGGSRGIGFACAREFLREGAKVTLVARGKESLANAKAALAEEGFSCSTFSADLSLADATMAMIERVEQEQGAIDVVVNSAGAASQMPFSELTPAHWQDAMNSKFMSYVNVMDPVIKRMAARGAGSIVNVIGIGGKIASVHHLAGGAANAALMLATAGLAAAYGRSGVRVNAVNPSTTFTERTAIGLTAYAQQRNITVGESLRQKTAHAALGRIAQPEEIADAVVYLSSSRASYISGAIVSMDGATNPIVI